MKITIDMVRDVLRGLSEEGRKSTITNALLYEAMELDTEPDKVRLRSRLNDLIRRGELERITPGEYVYHPQNAPGRNGEMYQRIWRAVRSSKPGFSFQDLARVTRASYSHCRKYGKWLLENGYLARHGATGNTALYRTTMQARETLQTPYPPLEMADPFEKEKKAACRLCRAMMERDPYQVAVRKRILESARIILERFDRKNPEEFGENNDVATAN